MDHLPRIDDVMVVAPWCLEIRWAQPADRAPVPPAISRVDLSGWVATGGDVLAPLRDLKLFNQATVGNYGASVTWDHGEGDLSIDALHVKELVEQQKPFSTDELNAWQNRHSLSNNESADLIHVALSTWNEYKAGRKVPKRVGMLLRAFDRDPLLLQAHFRPRKSGRPKADEASIADRIQNSNGGNF
ncbi:MAG: hypothetical protein AB1586_20135 [Pseudomonadota bacterium]